MTALTGVSARVSQLIVRRALERGMDPEARPFIVQPEWVADAPRSGRPSTRKTTEVRATPRNYRGEERRKIWTWLLINHLGARLPEQEGDLAIQV